MGSKKKIKKDQQKNKIRSKKINLAHPSTSCETSSKFHARHFKNEHFVRDFLQDSQRKLPKRAFRARLLPIFTDETSKASIYSDNIRVDNSATQWTSSVHTLHMSKPVITFVLTMPGSGAETYQQNSAPLWTK